MNLYIGYDIGGTKCSFSMGSVIDNRMAILSGERFATDKSSYIEILKQFENITREHLRDNGYSQKDIKGIGISCGGPLNSQKGTINSPPNLIGWDNVHIVDYYRNKFPGVNVYLQNDANACAVAEWKYGAGRGMQNVVFLTFGTGMGAGLILNGRLYRGRNDMAGEVGHIRLSEYGPVGYGKAGSFEGFCSGGGIAQLAKMRITEELQKGNKPYLVNLAGNISNIDAKIVAVAADNGDELSRQIYEECGRMLGRGLSLLMDILDPDAIIIGSIFVRSRHLLWDSMKKILIEESISKDADARIIPAELGEELGDIAALSVATGEY